MKRMGCGRTLTCLRGVAALHLTSSGLRATVPGGWMTDGIPMRTLFTSLKASCLAAAFALLALGSAAQAANRLERNFWLSGPRYDGQLAECEAALPRIMS